MTFFHKVHFIQKCSVTQNTVFQNVKNNFLLSQNKLVFFTILNLPISIVTSCRVPRGRHSCSGHIIFALPQPLSWSSVHYQRSSGVRMVVCMPPRYPRQYQQLTCGMRRSFDPSAFVPGHLPPGIE